MKKVLLFLLISVNFCYSQKSRKEVVNSEGVENNLTISTTGMYDDTISKEARKLYDKAYDYDKKQDYKNAESYYLKAIEKDSNFVEAYDNLGRVYRATNAYNKAVFFYKKSIKIYPNGKMAHQNLAVVYGILKDHEKANEEYDELVRLLPDDAEGYFGKANSYMMLRQFDAALENGNQALEIYKSTKSEHLSDAYYLIGLIHYYNGENRKAKEQLLLAKQHGAKIDAQLEAQLKM